MSSQIQQNRTNVKILDSTNYNNVVMIQSENNVQCIPTPAAIAAAQNGQNLLVVTRDAQGKEVLALADDQAIASLTLDSYCSYFFVVVVVFFTFFFSALYYQSRINEGKKNHRA